MKYHIPILLLVFLFCVSSTTQAAFVIRSKTAHVVAVPASNTANTGMELSGTTHTAAPPRGRGSGVGAMKTFLLGWFSIFPVLGLIPAFFAYKLGIKNIGRIRKHRGFAIAGMILATIGVVFTILILTVA